MTFAGSINPGGPGNLIIKVANLLNNSRNPWSDILNNLAAGQSGHVTLMSDSTAEITANPGAGPVTNAGAKWTGRFLPALAAQLDPLFRVEWHGWTSGVIGQQRANTYMTTWVVQAGTAGERGVRFTANGAPKSLLCKVNNCVARTVDDFEIYGKVNFDASTPPGGFEGIIITDGHLGGTKGVTLSQGGDGAINVWYMTTTGAGNWAVSGNTTTPSWSVPLATHGIQPGVDTLIRVEFTASTGTLVMKTSTNDGISWTTVATSAAAGATVVNKPSNDRSIGGDANGTTTIVSGTVTATTCFRNGVIYRAGIRDGIAGPLTHSYDIEDFCSTNTGLPAPSSLVGSPTLHFWNASKTGQNITYFNTNYKAMLHPVGKGLVLLGTGHNETTFGVDFTTLADTWLANVKGRTPGCNAFGIVVENPQNPTYNALAAQAKNSRDATFLAWARENNLLIHDVRQAFPPSQLGTLVNNDGIHPSESGGYMGWANRMLTETGFQPTVIF